MFQSRHVQRLPFRCSEWLFSLPATTAEVPIFWFVVGGERTGRESTNGAGGKEEVGFTVISAQCLDELRTNPKFQ